MDRMSLLLPSSERTARIKDQPMTKTPIFGLRYLEEEATEIHDVIGCLVNQGGGLTCSCIDDGE